jgi:3-hydroxybutyryl-CoA dehydratase
MTVRPHDRFSSHITLTPSFVADFARSTGDFNPVHHDLAYAATTRFKKPIASGTQTTALLMGLTATHFSRASAMLGLEFWFRFRRPIFADETIVLEWLVISVKPAPRLELAAGAAFSTALRAAQSLYKPCAVIALIVSRVRPRYIRSSGLTK